MQILTITHCIRGSRACVFERENNRKVKGRIYFALIILNRTLAIIWFERTVLSRDDRCFQSTPPLIFLNDNRNDDPEAASCHTTSHTSLHPTTHPCSLLPLPIPNCRHPDYLGGHEGSVQRRPAGRLVPHQCTVCETCGTCCVGLAGWVGR